MKRERASDAVMVASLERPGDASFQEQQHNKLGQVSSTLPKETDELSDPFHCDVSLFTNAQCFVNIYIPHCQGGLPKFGPFVAH